MLSVVIHNPNIVSFKERRDASWYATFKLSISVLHSRMTDSDLPVARDDTLAEPFTASDVKQDPQAVSPAEVQKPYSVFSRQEKWFIVSVVSFAGIFSPFTANIYFPAIPALVSAFHKSTELINLTVTVYMVVQAICTTHSEATSPDAY